MSSIDRAGDRRFANELRLYPEVAFGGFPARDGGVAFWLRVRSLVNEATIVLDYACGIGSHRREEDPFTSDLMRLRGRAARVIGIDTDPSGRDNPDVDEFLLLQDGRVPLDDAAVDLCVCEWGVEHFTDPLSVFREITRVMRVGGVLCIRTPNRWHYSSLGARLVPFSLHAAIRRRLGQFHQASDTFPVLYRANTRRRLAVSLSQCGLRPVVLRHRGPSHLVGMSPPLALFGDLLERWSPPACWHELHAFARKPAAPDATR